MTAVAGQELASFWAAPEPRQLPDVRTAAAEHLATPRKIESIATVLEEGRGTLRPRAASPLAGAALLAMDERDRLQRARLFYVTAPMAQLACRAGDALTEFDLRPEHLPAGCGFVLFADSIGTYVSDDVRVHIVGVSWGPSSLVPADAQQLWVTWWSATNYPYLRDVLQQRAGLRHTDAERAARAHETEITWDNEVLLPLDGDVVPADLLPRTITGHTGGLEGADLAGDDTLLPWVQRLRATWLLMTQRNYAETRAETANRQTRRRSERAGCAHSDVEVVRIGASRAKRPAGRAGTGTPWGVQTIVPGHWRQQAYGRGRSLRRPVWIDDYHAGPGDAPWSPRMKVNLLDK